MGALHRIDPRALDEIWSLKPSTSSSQPSRNEIRGLTLPVERRNLGSNERLLLATAAKSGSDACKLTCAASAA
jgi:hypothetical protein